MILLRQLKPQAQPEKPLANKNESSISSRQGESRYKRLGANLGAISSFRHQGIFHLCLCMATRMQLTFTKT